jgi:hypothetical protein
VHTITVTNSGAAPTNGYAVTVTDLLPSGLTATATAGKGIVPPGGATNPANVIPALGENALLLLALLIGLLGAGYTVRRTAR